MPGVVAASSDLASRIARGMVRVWLSVDVAEDITADQLAAITAGHLDELRRVDYSAHQTEPDVRAGSNLFAVDSGTRPVTNTQQILGQASRWVALHREFPSATSHSAPQSATRQNHRPATPARQRAKHPAPTSATAAPAPSTSPTPPTTPTSRKP